jgi:hypothetical protein
MYTCASNTTTVAPDDNERGKRRKAASIFQTKKVAKGKKGKWGYPPFFIIDIDIDICWTVANNKST